MTDYFFTGQKERKYTIDFLPQKIVLLRHLVANYETDITKPRESFVELLLCYVIFILINNILLNALYILQQQIIFLIILTEYRKHLNLSFDLNSNKTCVYLFAIFILYVYIIIY